MPGASAELIDKAYRLRMREVHPDLAGATRSEQAALVNTAGEILREPTARARYDALRAAHRARPGARQGMPPGQPRGRDPGEERHRRALEDQLAASEASRRELAEQVQWLASQVRSRPGRRVWAGCAVGVVLGVELLSLVLGMAGSSQVRAAPYTPPLVVPAPAASAVVGRGADAEWPAVLHELDATWEQDWPATVTRLERFLDRWPGYPAAEDKLYAALVADAEGHLQAEQVAAGVAELERAARRQPERGEAWARLAQLATAAPGEHP